eukprot:gnl/MRDRNA2_/MRDRNA2_34888_c0_seq1.p1 gnl/MRDRNA2_/MRDRNA2_34888_c0~~gnl/MRDRNA2_/MRDRNA2_34888_c0_seq1.p1  ORF type:complete len:575 (-),score=88.81 gnl/MRDRNA2_/MRDRNA2_34888_c0_seq1:92-1732(-)
MAALAGPLLAQEVPRSTYRGGAVQLLICHFLLVSSGCAVFSHLLSIRGQRQLILDPAINAAFALPALGTGRTNAEMLDSWMQSCRSAAQLLRVSRFAAARDCSQVSLLHHARAESAMTIDRTTTMTHTEPKSKHSASQPLITSAAGNSRLGVDNDQQLHELHVISLRKPKKGFEPWESAAWLCWQWKDAVMGDGRDMFLPRPRTCRKLAAAIVASSCVEVPIVEAAVLGNCKRFDAYVRCADGCSRENVKKHVLAQVAMQIEQWRCANTTIPQAMSRLLTTPPTSWHDRDDLVSWPAVCGSTPSTLAHELSHRFIACAGPREVVEHCCLVAMGLEARKYNPSFTWRYNPSSARAAHIMCQLRRAFEAVSAPASGQQGSPKSLSPPCGTYLGLVLRTALEAGKAARNPDKLPKAREIWGQGNRKGFGIERRGSLAAEEEARTIVLQPAVERCLEKLRAVENSDKICKFRKSVEASVNEMVQQAKVNDPSRLTAVNKRVQRMLHQPTLVLRNGGSLDEEEVVGHIADTVKSMLRNSDGLVFLEKVPKI